MNEYELFNEKTAESRGPYLSDTMLEKNDVITFQGENYFVSNLLIPKDQKLIVAVWPAKIYLPGDIENPRLLRWLQENLIGMKIRLSNNKGSIKGTVIDLWPDIKSVPSRNLKSVESSEAFHTEDYSGRREFLILWIDNPAIIDLLIIQ